jgi:DNA-binding SARP family transcriptional activator
VQVRLLGPVDVTAGGVPQPVHGLRRKAVLAVLGLHAGEVVSAARLIDVVWAGDAPATAANALQSHVSYLRGVLGVRAVIVARPPGYLLDIGPDATDVEVAERLIRQGELASDRAERVARYRAVLALWRGRPLLDVTGLPWLDQQAGRLEDLRLVAVRALVEARLDLGEHARLVPELERLSREHPFDEHVYRQLMLALYRSGRQTDALAAYQRLWRTLSNEMGVEPGPALRDLESAILRHDDTLDPARPPITTPAPAPPAATGAGANIAAPPPAPRELPPDVYAFTGRRHALAELDGLLAAAAAGSAVPVFVVSGTGGVGKTALAVHWAHRVADRFPAGQLYLDLRGYDPAEPMTPEQALASLLGSLGVNGADMPAGPAERGARLRTLLAGRRMLVLFDNALDAEQVRPLLPGTAGCAAVVTSRDDLAGLVARDGARRVGLGVLSPDEVRDLLHTLIGDRVVEEPALAETLARHCGRLPLALRIAAERVAARPDTPLAVLEAELATERGRMDLLTAGSDTGTGIRAVFSWSERHLPAPAMRLFRLLGLHPGHDIDAGAAAALAGTAPDEARRLIEVLDRAHLVERTAPGRWTMHDLLRDYAHEQVLAQADEPVRLAALTGLYRWYLAGAAAAMRRMFPESARRWPGPFGTDLGEGGAAPDRAPTFADAAAARAWLEMERPNLVAAVRAAGAGLSGHAVEIARTLARYLDVGYHNADAFALHRRAHDLATNQGDRAGVALALHELGLAHARSGRFADAIDHHRRALEHYTRLDDLIGRARCHLSIGVAEHFLANYGAAFVHCRRSFTLFRRAADPAGEARALGNLGRIHLARGRHREAAQLFEEVVDLFDSIGDRVGLGRNLNEIGTLRQHQGRLAEAYDCHERARLLLNEVGDTAAEACSLVDLGRISSRWGRHDDALHHHNRAVEMFRGIGDRIGEVEALIGLGETHRRAGRPGDAVREHRSAHAVATEIDNARLVADSCNALGRSLCAVGAPTEAVPLHEAARAHAVDVGDRLCQARALDGLARAAEAAGRPAETHRHRIQAMVIYTELDMPDAEAVRARIRATNSPKTAAVAERGSAV